MIALKEKFIHVIFISITVFLLFSAKCFADAIVSIQPATSNQIAGNLFDVSVDISDVSDLYAFQFDINFDPTVLQAVGSTEGSFLPIGGGTLFMPGDIDNIGGSVSFIADCLSGFGPGVTGTGNLVVLSFQALNQGMSTISLSNLFLLDSNLSDIPFTLYDGTVNVSKSTVPEPAMLLLLGLGLIGTTALRKFRK